MDLIEKYLGERMSTKDSPLGKAVEYVKKYRVTKNKKWLDQIKNTLGNTMNKSELDSWIKSHTKEY